MVAIDISGSRQLNIENQKTGFAINFQKIKTLTFPAYMFYQLR